MDKKIRKDSYEDLKELELLNKYYDVDDEKKMITMPLHYEKASDLIDSTVISKDNFLFDYEVLTSINNRIRRIPILYDVTINIQIDDYEGYDPKKLLDGFNDALELNNFNLARERRKKWLQSAILLTIGLIILFFVAYGKVNLWFGEGNQSAVYSEVFDIIGWVFIWQTVTVAFLSPSELGVNSFMFKRRVKFISFLDYEDKVLASENAEDLFNKWKDETRLAFATRWSLLISGVSLLVLAIIRMIELIGEFNLANLENLQILFNGETSSNSLLVIIFLVFTESVLMSFAGLLNLSLYKRKKIHRKLSYTFSCIMGLIIIMTIVNMILTNDLKLSITSNVITILMSGLYMFGAISTLQSTKQAK